VITEQSRVRNLGAANGQRGFTLLEVLIAVTITALIGIGVWQVVDAVINSRERVNKVAEEFEAIQRAVLLIERDLGQVVNRRVRDIYGDSRLAFTSREDAYALNLTRQGWRNPIGKRRSELQRAAYEFTGDELHRRYWPMLDRGQESEGRDQILLDGLTDFRLRFMDADGNWQESWPLDSAFQQATANAQSGGSAEPVPLPRGVEVVIVHEQYGDITRIIALPDFDLDAARNVITQSNNTGEGQNPETDTEGDDLSEGDQP
jgi:general secretion pathway protein J